MKKFNQSLTTLRRWMVMGLIVTLVWLQGAIAAPAQAAFSFGDDFETPDGQDITEIVECLPQQLTEGDLQRAISKFGNDYLERVFQLKDDYGDYKISQAEKEFQSCLQSKGITPNVKKNQLQR
jgi:hypothetical protein